MLINLDQEQKRVMDAREAADRNVAQLHGKEPAHYFRMMKELTVESPGRFDPCIPSTAGEPAWTSQA